MSLDMVTDSQHLGRQAKRGGEQLTHARQLGWLARFGLVARGAVYFVIGLLALGLALGEGGKATSQQGAMKTIAAQPFGKVLLILLAIGLAGFALWRLTRAAIGHGAEQQDGAGDRVAALASGIAYLILCVTAVSILAGAGSTSGSPKEATAGVLGWSGGTVLVAIAGIVLIGAAIYQAHRGLSRDFLEDAKASEMSAGVRKTYTALGVVGLVARAVIFALIGYGLIKAAIDYQPKEAVGIEGALRNLTETSFGPLLLAAVAAGLIVFALYSMADARYRKV